MPEITLDPLVGRVREALRDTDLPKADFEAFARDLRRVDTPSAIEQLTKAIERIDIPKAIERIDVPKAIGKLELPSAIEDRLPMRRKRRRAPMGLFGLLGAAALVAATIALVPSVRRRLRGVLAGAREQVQGMRGDAHWSKGAGLPVAFPESPTMPVVDDPAIPGSPAPYPEGLGDQDATLETPFNEYSEVTR